MIKECSTTIVKFMICRAGSFVLRRDHTSHVLKLHYFFTFFYTSRSVRIVNFMIPRVGVLLLNTKWMISRFEEEGCTVLALYVLKFCQRNYWLQSPNVRWASANNDFSSTPVQHLPSVVSHIFSRTTEDAWYMV